MTVFQTKYTPENTFILFIFRVRKFWRGENNDENTANAAINPLKIDRSNEGGIIFFFGSMPTHAFKEI